MAWFRKEKKPLKAADRRDLPGDVFDKCEGCGEILYREKLAENDFVCPSCAFHFRIPAERYIELLMDEAVEDVSEGQQGAYPRSPAPPPPR